MGGDDDDTNEPVASAEPRTDETTAAPTEPAPEPTPDPAPDPAPEPSVDPTPEPIPEPTPEPQTPKQPPPTPDPEQLAGTTGDGTEAPELPEGLVLVDKWVTPIDSGKNTNQRGARRVCEKLASEQHLGIKGWKLANPTIAMKFVDNDQLRKSWYWTSAAHKGKAVMVGLPAGKKYSPKGPKAQRQGPLRRELAMRPTRSRPHPSAC